MQSNIFDMRRLSLKTDDLMENVRQKGRPPVFIERLKVFLTILNAQYITVKNKSLMSRS